MKRFAIAFIFLLLIGSFTLVPSRPWADRGGATDEVAAVIALGSKADLPSPLGLSPPSEVIDEAKRRSLGIRLPANLPAPLTKSLLETRKTPDGSYFTELGEGVILAQRPRDLLDSPWTLHVPQDIEGELLITSTRIENSAALAVMIPDRFARIEWGAGDWQYVLVDAEGTYPLTTLLQIARTLK